MELRLVRKINNGWNSDLEIMKGQTWDSFPCVFLEHTFHVRSTVSASEKKGSRETEYCKIIFFSLDTTVINMYPYFL